MKFSAWFNKKFGKRPGWVGYTDSELLAMIVSGNRARAALEAAREWDARRQSALYAWNADDAYKKQRNP